jgi:hypothetical protein
MTEPMTATDVIAGLERLRDRVAFLEGMGPHPFTPTRLPPQLGLCHECGLERSARIHTAETIIDEVSL